jgi:hypothetical protein
MAPSLYVRMTGATGRGRNLKSPDEVAGYFWRCFDDYLGQLNVPRGEAAGFLEGKRILEYGPGDIPGVAMLFVAHGAASVTCVDRFPLVSLSTFNVKVLRVLLDSLSPEARARAEACFVRKGDPASGLDCDRIRYLVTPSGLVDQEAVYSLVVSRAVLAVVNDLAASLADMERALITEGLMLHRVDLDSHGMHQEQRLDFLTWNATLWRLMYSEKGVPNRWRLNYYRDRLAELGLVVLRLAPTAFADTHEIDAVRPRLAKEFRDVTDRDLSCLEFWLLAGKG